MFIQSNFEKICETYNEKFVKFIDYRHFNRELDEDQKRMLRNMGATYFDFVEGEVFEDERKLLELLDSFNQINDALENLIEKKSVFDKSSQLVLSGYDSNYNPGILEEGQKSDLNFIAGVIKAEDDLRMKRMIFRISRGRAIPTFFDLVNENRLGINVRNVVNPQKPQIAKKIFTIFFQGGNEGTLMQKLIKVCDIFSASRFTVPRREEMYNQINQLQGEIVEKQNFLRQAITSIKDFIRNKIGHVRELYLL
jgi:V-type H+-transporting ATPase subunit a